MLLRRSQSVCRRRFYAAVAAKRLLKIFTRCTLFYSVYSVVSFFMTYLCLPVIVVEQDRKRATQGSPRNSTTN